MFITLNHKSLHTFLGSDFPTDSAVTHKRLIRVDSFIQRPVLQLRERVCFSIVLHTTVMQLKPVCLVTINANNQTCQTNSQALPVTFTDTP